MTVNSLFYVVILCTYISSHDAAKPEDLVWGGQVCEGDDIKLFCEPGYLLTVESAVWEAGATDKCAKSTNENSVQCRESVISKINCNGLEECTVSANTQTLGNPCPRVVKILSISYRCSMPSISRLRCHDSCQNAECDFLELSCDKSDEVIYIANAFYGRKDTSTCASSSSNNTMCDGDEGLATKVSKICNGRQHCKIGDVSSSYFGNPSCSDVSPYLEVEYVCGSCTNFGASDSECSGWATAGECSNNPAWMSANCRKPCWQCDPDKVACENVLSNDECDHKAGMGECETNANYMHTNCQKACKKCGEEIPWMPEEKDVYEGEVCEGQYLNAHCGDDTGLVIRMKEVFFGRTDVNICPSDEGLLTNCTSPSDSLSRAQRVCDGRERCLLGGEVDAWGDPCPGQSKYMYASFTCQKCENVVGDDECEQKKANGDCASDHEWMLDNCFATCTGCQFSSACDNVHESWEDCDTWSLRNECVINEYWMASNCRTSCRLCTEEDIKDEGECIDSNMNCAYWASQGECEANPDAMLIYCRRSCGVCGEPRTGCFNAIGEDESCDKWAADGECTNNEPWMAPSCRKACFLCASATAPPGCSNIEANPSCEYWAGTEECELNAPFMYENCAWSCRVCDAYPASCVNIHDDSQCNYWRGLGECEISSWMLDNCAQACAVCEADCDDDVKAQCDDSCAQQMLKVKAGTHCTTCECVDPCDLTPCPDEETCKVRVAACDGATCGMEAVCECSESFVDECQRMCHNKNEVMKYGNCSMCQCTSPCENITCDVAKYCHVRPGEVNAECGSDHCAPTTECVDCSFESIVACENQCDGNEMVPVRGTECTGCQCKPVCKDEECPTGQYCVSRRVTCIRAPCLPIPSCIDCPTATKQACQETCYGQGLVPVPDSECNGCQCQNACEDVVCDTDKTCVSITEECDSEPCPVEHECIDSCNDLYDEAACEDWAVEGYCVDDFMKTNCRRSCYMCSKVEHPTGCTNFVADEYCDRWAGTNQCGVNPDFMLGNCSWSCRNCDSYSDNCADVLPNCTAWALHGECHINTNWMETNCPRACGMCQTAAEMCKDMVDTGDCESWATQGFCTDDYMKANCRKSCFLCSKVQAPEGCSNLVADEYCHRWAATSECENNPEFMLGNCSWSCKTCNVIPSDCQDIHSNCTWWSLQGECHLNNREWMETNCPRSCGMCFQDTDCGKNAEEISNCEQQCDADDKLMTPGSLCSATCDCVDPCDPSIATCGASEQCEVVRVTQCVTDKPDVPCGLQGRCYCPVATVTACQQLCASNKKIRVDGNCDSCECTSVCTNHECPQGEYCVERDEQCASLTEPCVPEPQCTVCSSTEILSCQESCAGMGQIPVENTECSGCQCRDVCQDVVCEEGEECVRVLPAESCTGPTCLMEPQCVEKCVNLAGESDCDLLAEEDKCNSDEEYMSVNCRKSCFMCSQLTPPPDCADAAVRATCTYWAGKGECAKNSWLMDNCKWACRNCDSYLDDCVDTDALCLSWAGVGECHRNQLWMVTNCPRACGQCQPDCSREEMQHCIVGCHSDLKIVREGTLCNSCECYDPCEDLQCDSPKECTVENVSCNGDVFTRDCGPVAKCQCPPQARDSCELSCANQQKLFVGLSDSCECQCEDPCKNHVCDEGFYCVTGTSVCTNPPCAIRTFCQECPAGQKTACVQTCAANDEVPVAGTECTSCDCQSTCSDVLADGLCATYEQEGYCIADPDFMYENCRKTCFYCGDNQVPPEGCANVDSNHSCDYWAGIGECTANNNIWMNTYCTWSCRSCEQFPADCQNLYDDETCQQHRGHGGCELNENEVTLNCQRTCNMCTQMQANKTTTPSDGNVSPSSQTTTIISMPSSTITSVSTSSPSTSTVATSTIATSTTSTSTIKPTSPIQDIDCFNTNGDTACNHYATAYNFCNLHTDWMSVHCTKACGKCVPVSSLSPRGQIDYMVDGVTCSPPCLHGVCVKPDETCLCFEGYTGPTCAKLHCPGNCSGHGACIGPNKCQCDEDYSGHNCSNELSSATVKPSFSTDGITSTSSTTDGVSTTAGIDDNRKMKMEIIFNIPWYEFYKDVKSSQSIILRNELENILLSYYTKISANRVQSVDIIKLSQGSVIATHTVVFKEAQSEAEKIKLQCDSSSKKANATSQLLGKIEFGVSSKYACGRVQELCQHGTLTSSNNGTVYCRCEEGSSGEFCDETSLSHENIIIIVVCCVGIPLLLFGVICVCCRVHNNTRKRKDVNQETTSNRTTSTTMFGNTRTQSQQSIMMADTKDQDGYVPRQI